MNKKKNKNKGNTFQYHIEEKNKFIEENKSQLKIKRKKYKKVKKISLIFIITVVILLTKNISDNLNPNNSKEKREELKNGLIFLDKCEKGICK